MIQMIEGIGIDILELARVRAILERTPHFYKKILSKEEQMLFERLSSKKRQVEFLAGRFSAKEAFSKAYGTGIGKEVGFHDISILYDERGKPVIHFKEELCVHVSISHSQHYVVAEVIIERRHN